MENRTGGKELYMGADYNLGGQVEGESLSPFVENQMNYGQKDKEKRRYNAVRTPPELLSVVEDNG